MAPKCRLTNTVAPASRRGSGVDTALSLPPSVKLVPKIEKITPGAKLAVELKLAAFTAAFTCGEGNVCEARFVTTRHDKMADPNNNRLMVRSFLFQTISWLRSLPCQTSQHFA